MSDIFNKTYHHQITLLCKTTQHLLFVFFLTICCSLVTSKYIYVFPTLFMWSFSLQYASRALCMCVLCVRAWAVRCLWTNFSFLLSPVIVTHSFDFSAKIVQFARKSLHFENSMRIPWYTLAYFILWMVVSICFNVQIHCHH